jgi:DNA-binding CsgD family transcriptional regulator
MNAGLVGRDEVLESIDSLLERRRPVLLTGHAGVGKTALAREVKRGQKQRSRRVSEVNANLAARETSLGAFSCLVQPSFRRAEDVRTVLWAIQQSIIGDDGRAAFLYVDDVHLLDDLSLVLVDRLVRSSDVRIVMTVRTGEAIPPAITALWSDGAAERVEVGPLDPASLSRMVGAVLGAPLAPETHSEFWRLSQGNPLCAREIALSALERREIALGGGMARHTQTLSVDGRVTELIEARLAHLPTDVSSALRVLAAAGEVPVLDLERAVGLDAMSELERRHLVRFRSDGQRRCALAAHPLYGELMARSMRDAEQRRVYRLLYEATVDLPGRRADDAVRRAEWGLRAAAAIPVQLLVRAAESALTSYSAEAGERFARAAIGILPSISNQLILVEALVLQGRIQEACDLLEQLAHEASDDIARAQVAAVHAGVDALVLKDFEAALRRLEAAERVASTAAAKDMIASRKGSVLMFVSGTDAARAAIRPVIERERPTDERNLLAALGIAVSINGWAGRISEARRHGDRAARLATRRQDLRLAEVAPAHMTRAWTMLHEGDALRSIQFLKVARQRHPGLGQIFDAALGIAYAICGRAAMAETTLRGAHAALTASGDPLGQVSWAVAMRMLALTALGDRRAAAACRAEIGAMPAGASWHFIFEVDRALGVWEATFGSSERALERFRSSVEHSSSRGMHAFTVLTVDDMARLGWADDAAVLGAEIAASAEPGWVVAHGVAAHADALVASDPDGLASAADEYAGWGWTLRAAEVACTAACAFAVAGDVRAAYREELRARAWLSQHDAVQTPLLEERSQVLGERCETIADLVAEGLTNAQIADRLVLSRRTVENHLYRVYSDLDLSGRKALRSMIVEARESATQACGPSEAAVAASA